MSNTASYVRLGKTGLRVSAPILGCMSIGSAEWMHRSLPEDKAFPVLKTAWEAGINTGDTANMYSNGRSEMIIGKFITENQIPRNKLVLITKINFLVDEEDIHTVTSFFKPHLKDQRDYVNQGGLSRAAIFNQVEASLRRLKTDYVDILMIHAFDSCAPMEETMQALNDIVRSGKARYLGASNLKAWQLVEMNNIAQRHGWVEFSCYELEHSLLYRTEERELIDYCTYKGIGIVAYSPLMDGHLARPVGIETARSQDVKGTFIEKRRRESDNKIIGRVQEIADKRSWKMAQVALAWTLTKVSSPIVGANSPERVLESITTGKQLTDEEVKYLEEL
ncbi:hypothetical protein H0H93_006308 [Arthromyces matolae]|nr:hypothetical protein H0H93_006308 [Arthromyces matolae]